MRLWAIFCNGALLVNSLHRTSNGAWQRFIVGGQSIKGLQSMGYVAKRVTVSWS